MKRNWLEVALCCLAVGTLWGAGAQTSPVPYPDFYFDCNNNGVEDSVDIAQGASSDANRNAIPDECESPATLGDPYVTLLVSPYDYTDMTGFQGGP